MNGEMRNTSPRQKEKLHIKDRECIVLKHFIKSWRSKRKHGVCEHAGSNLRDLKTRPQGIVDSEVVQKDNQLKLDCFTNARHHAKVKWGGTAMAAGGPAPEDSQMTLAQHFSFLGP